MTPPVTAASAAGWVDRYVGAWLSNDPEEIGDLFTPDAVYRTGPWDDPIAGRRAIVEDWLARRDEPGTWEFSSEVLAVAGDLAVVTGRTAYTDPPAEYANLWIIRFGDEARCRDFTEWYVRAPEE